MPLDICKQLMVCVCEGECVCVRERKGDGWVRGGGGTCVVLSILNSFSIWMQLLQWC